MRTGLRARASWAAVSYRWSDHDLDDNSNCFVTSNNYFGGKRVSKMFIRDGGGIRRMLLMFQFQSIRHLCTRAMLCIPPSSASKGVLQEWHLNP